MSDTIDRENPDNIEYTDYTKDVKTQRTELITCKEAARLYPIGEHKFRELCKSKIYNFPSIKIDSRYYIVKNKLDEWLENQIGIDL